MNIDVSQGALVSVDASFDLFTSVQRTPADEALKSIVTVHVGCNTIMQPSAKISVLVNEAHDFDSIVLKIGENNIFEEKSEVTINLSDYQSKSSGKIELDIIGRGNYFQSRCSVRCKSLGDFNIFGQCSLVRINESHRSAFSSLVEYDSEEMEKPLEGVSVFRLDDGIHCRNILDSRSDEEDIIAYCSSLKKIMETYHTLR